MLLIFFIDVLILKLNSSFPRVSVHLPVMAVLTVPLIYFIIPSIYQFCHCSSVCSEALPLLVVISAILLLPHPSVASQARPLLIRMSLALLLLTCIIGDSIFQFLCIYSVLSVPLLLLSVIYVVLPAMLLICFIC